MKAAGAVLILLGFLAGGVNLCRSRRRRLSTLRELETSLQLLAAELETRASELQTIFSFLGDQKGETGAFFRELSENMDKLGEYSFRKIWESAVKRNLGSLRPDEREGVLRLGGSLGRYETQQQLQILHTVLSSLAKQRESASLDYPNERRLFLGLAVSFGCLAALVLL